jgi:poly-gamma-glutamate synthesis protein (capsule biosynthesis protein)
MRRSIFLWLVLFGLVLYGFFNNEIQSGNTPVLAVGEMSPRPGLGGVTDLPEVTKPNEVYFLGDVMLARDVEQRILQSGNDFPFAKITFPKTSFVVANFESASPALHTKTPNNTFRFSTRREFLPILRTLGVTHVSLANNHTYDYGLAGYNETVTALWGAELIPFGHPTQVASTSVQYLETASGTVAILALHTLFSAPEPGRLAALLKEMREQSDWQVVYVHWGEEYVIKPNTAERTLAKQLVAEGVDLIVGHHPHVVESIERVDGVLVFYSLGNFIFDQYFSTEVQQGLVLRLTFDHGPRVELLPVSSEEVRIQPQYMEALAKSAFLTKLASSSDPVLTQGILEGVLSL